MSANYSCLGSAPYPAAPNPAALAVTRVRWASLQCYSLTIGDRSMDRRSFVTSVLMSVGIFAAAVGAANALPAVAPRDHLVSVDYDGIENVWWRRRYWRRRYWRRW